VFGSRGCSVDFSTRAADNGGVPSEAIRMPTAVVRELFEPYPFFRHPEPWFLFERGRRQVVHAWERVATDTLRTGDAERLHSARDDYQAILLGYLKVLDGYQMLADRFGGVGGPLERNP
jgi:hypothetical protein